ncbi:MAG: M56 family metallopeptidase [Lachnospiraceae bacterium]
MIRMLVPVNFPFSITLYDTKLLPYIGKIIYARFYGVMYFTIGVGIWAVVMLFLLGRLIYRTVALNKSVSAFIDRNICLTDYLTEYADNKNINKIDVAIVPDNISPFIMGIFHPVMVLPRFCMDNNNLEDIICHEIEHNLNYDLYLKLLMELLICIYWWNPMIYILRKQFLFSLELSNDASVIKDKSDEARAEYANCILDVMKKTQRKTNLKIDYALPFTDFTKKHAVIRMERILYGDLKNRKTVLYFNCFVIISIAIIGCVFVPEALSSPGPTESDVFDVEPENAYFIKTNAGYDIYVDSKYKCTFQEIPEDFKNIEVK